MSLLRKKAEHEARRRRAQNSRPNPVDTGTIATENIIGSEASTGLTRQGSGEVAPALGSASEPPQAQRRQTTSVEEQNILDSPDAPRMRRRGSRAYVSAMRTTSARKEGRSKPLKRIEPVRWLTLGSTETSANPAGRSNGQAPIVTIPASVLVNSNTTPEVGPPEETQPPVPNKTVTTPVTVPAEEEPNSSQDYALYEEAEAAVNNSVDPIYTVIQRLAARAENDHNLRDLMRIIAAGNSSSAQRIDFQVHMMEIEASDPPNMNVNDRQVEDDTPESDSDDKENTPPASSTRGCSSTNKRTIGRSSSQPRQPLGLLPVPSEDGDNLLESSSNDADPHR